MKELLAAIDCSVHYNPETSASQFLPPGQQAKRPTCVLSSDISDFHDNEFLRTIFEKTSEFDKGKY